MPTTYADPAARLVASGSADVAFIAGAPEQVDADLVIEWDLDNDGDFDQPVEDVTGYVVDLDSLVGRDYPSQLNGQSSPGQLRLMLYNDDGRFSQHSAASPLNAAPFALRVGRRVRVRAAESSFTDPVLLARDRFKQSDGDLLADELGNAWLFPGPARFARNDFTAEATAVAQNVATVDVGASDHYVQARIARHGYRTSGATGSLVGIVGRYESPNDSLAVVVDVDAGQIRLVETIGGAFAVLSASGLEVVDHVTLGLQVVGTLARVLLDGVHIMSATVAANADGTQAGLIATWQDANQLAPRLDDFHVWNGIHTLSGSTESLVLWTGDVTELTPDVEVDGRPVVEVRAEGVLARTDRIEVESPRFITRQGTGFMVGRIFSTANALHPPARSAIQGGTAAMGPSNFDEERGPALEFARVYEETERGFIWETPEGYLAFDQANARDTLANASTVQASFSDAPGAQFGFHRIAPISAREDIVNRVTAGVAHGRALDGGVLGSTASTAVGVANDVGVTIPADVEDGELLVYAVAATIGTAGVEWLKPIWWVPERDAGAELRRQRIYTHISDGTDGGTAVTFYDDTGPSGGAQTWFLFRFKPGEWFGTHDGIHIAEHVNGHNPPVVIPPWGPVPTRYIAMRCGFASAAGATVASPVYPQGFTGGNSSFVNGATNGHDVAQQYASRESNESIMDPGSFGGTFTGFTVVESTVIAIRGFNGVTPHDNGVVTVDVDDRESQDEYNQVVTHVAASSQFADVDAAEGYGEAIVAQYGAERPRVAITFHPTKNAGYRLQALQRGLSDRIRLVADGASRMGISGDFHIESIAHRVGEGGKHWETTWELSPAGGTQ